MEGAEGPWLEFVIKIAHLFQVSADQLLRDDLDLPDAQGENWQE